MSNPIEDGFLAPADTIGPLQTVSDPLGKFPLGQMVATPGALDAFATANTRLYPYLKRHVRGDWGDLDPSDAKANTDALTLGNRIMSVYALPTGVKIWIITESDRSATTVLLPEEY